MFALGLWLVAANSCAGVPPGASDAREARPFAADRADRPPLVSPPIRLPEEDVDRWWRHIAPGGDLRDSWLPSAEAGLFAADAMGRPLLLWVESAHPLSCSCPGDLMGGREAFADPLVRQFLSEFVLAADARYPIETSHGPAARLVRAACAEPGGTIGSGLYALSPSGVLLSKVHVLRAEPLATALSEALEAWFELEPADRSLRPDSGLDPASHPRRALEPSGIALSMVSRPLPLGDDPLAPRHPDEDRDEVWFPPSLAAELIADDLGVGNAWRADRVANHLARRHLVDPQEPEPFEGGDVLEAGLEVRVEKIEGRSVRLRLRGRTSAAAADGRAVSTRIEGYVLVDRRTGELGGARIVAKGYVRRAGHKAWFPVGFAFRDSPIMRRGFVLPRFGVGGE